MTDYYSVFRNDRPHYKWVAQNCHHELLYMVHNHCDFEKGFQNQHFQSTLLVGRKKVTLLAMLTILVEFKCNFLLLKIFIFLK